MLSPSRILDCDVAVLGAGVSGLLLAARLARHHHVILVERQSRPSAAKFWVTSGASASLVPELAPAIDCRYRHVDLIDYSEATLRVVGDFVLWQSQLLVSLLESQARLAGVTILYEHRAYASPIVADRILVRVNDMAIRARLAVDCMGYSSPLLYSKQAIEIVGYYLLVGGTFRLSRPMEPVGLHNMMMARQPVYIEAFPTRDDHVHIALILPSRESHGVTELSGDLSFLVGRSPYRNLVASASPVSTLGGIIPIGRMRRRATERLLFFGEAGQVNPATSATGLTRMLCSVDRVAFNIRTCLDHGTLDAKSLSAVTRPVLDDSNRAFQHALFREILSADSDGFAGLLSELTRMDDGRFIQGIIFGDLDLSASALRSFLVRLLRERCTRLLRCLLKATPQLLASLLHELPEEVLDNGVALEQELQENQESKS